MSGKIGGWSWPGIAKGGAAGRVGSIALVKDGFYIQGQAITGALCVGTFGCQFDNTLGGDDMPVTIVPGSTFKWERFQNSTGLDVLAQVDVGKDCYVAGEMQVAKTNGGGTRVKCGRVWAVDERGVLVGINPYL